MFRTRPALDGAAAVMVAGSSRHLLRNVVIAFGTIALVIGSATVPSAAAPARHTAITTYDLRAAADTYVTASEPHHAWGSADQIQATDEHGHRKRAFVRFTLPKLAAHSITRAELVFTRTGHHLGGLVRLRPVADRTWSEHRMTRASAPRSGHILAAVRTNSRMHKVTFHVSTRWIHGHSVAFALTSPSRHAWVAFRSREAGWGAPMLRLSVRRTVQGMPGRGTSTPPPTSSPHRPCTVSAKLVPSCGYWWGIAPKAHTSTPRDVALNEDEAEARTHFTLVHTYHENDQLFPTAQEQAMALAPGQNRILLINWKPATDMTWAQVAAGQADARIDRLANYLNSSFPYPFFLTIWHEPENDVNATAGSGMTATDYAAMFRHVVLRLRADGATKPVIVMDYMGSVNWVSYSWFWDLYPGDDVVDWIAFDPYGSGQSGVWQSGDFAKLVNRSTRTFPGYYTWATTAHPTKPIMLAEWGVNEGTNDPSGKANYLTSVSAQLPKFPAIKALAYFDENIPTSTEAGFTTDPASTPQSLAAFQRLCSWAASRGPVPVYASDDVEVTP